MISRCVGRLVLLMVIGAITALSAGCDGTVGVGIGVGYPYAPYESAWGSTTWVGGPVIR